MKDDDRSLVRGRGMAHAVLSFGSTVVLGLVSAFVISRIYGVAVVGEFALVSAPYVLVSQFSNLGEQYALVHTLSTEEPSSSRSASIFAVVLGFSTVITLLAGALAAPIAVLLLNGPADHPELVTPALLLIVAYALLANPVWNCDMLQTAFRGTGALLGGRLFDVAFLLVASVVLGLTRSPTTSTLVLATVLTFGLGLVLRIVLLRRMMTGRPTRPALREAVRELPALVRFGIPIVPGALGQSISSQAGLWLISAVRPVAVLGAYSRANNLANRLLEAGHRLSEVLLPGLSAACRRRDYREAAASFSLWRRLVALGLCAACAPAAGAAEGLLGLFGPGFAAAALPLGLLLLGYSAGVLTQVHGSFLLALERPGKVSNLVLLRSAVTLALVAPLTLWLGATGAAAALAAGFLIELVAAVRRTVRELAPTGAAVERLPWASLLVATALAVALARAVDVVLDGPLGTVVAGLAGLIAFCAAALATRLVQLAELQRLAARLPGRARAGGAALPAQPAVVPAPTTEPAAGPGSGVP